MLKFLFALLAAPIVNLTWSPDSSKVAFTRDNDLYYADMALEDVVRLTEDGTDTIMNGYASWVYYEEIFGRPSKYRAFWWSPDSKKLAFYRFDDSAVPMFPIYSPFGQGGRLLATRYPKAGQKNPSVRIFIADLEKGTMCSLENCPEEEYYGTPFWSADSRELYVSVMPRRQSKLDLYAVSAENGSRRHVYGESYDTWIDWIEGMLFTDKGLYMARDFETGWQQIYFLSYDGKTFRRVTDGKNWNITLLKVDEAEKYLWFTAYRDSRLHPCLYRLNLRNGRITSMTSPDYWVSDVKIADDGSFSARCSNASTPWFSVSGDRKGKVNSENAGTIAMTCPVSVYPSLERVVIENDGYELYGLISYPKGFNPSDTSKKYPVVMMLYGGPGTAYVRDRWNDRDASDKWCWENGVIYMVVDPRSSGENGRKGMDEAFRGMTVIELQDYIAWAKYMQGLPYVDGSRIGVEGFSFGGTTTSMLVLRYPEYFRCGIAGGGVYDWTLYDTHYTERFMCTPQENPRGYDEASVLYFVKNGLTSTAYRPNSLKLTHGTGDDNVHFQNTLQLVDALQQKGIQFELMVYPDGMHGYRGYQGKHSDEADHDFWTRNLLNR